MFQKHSDINSDSGFDIIHNHAGWWSITLSQHGRYCVHNDYLPIDAPEFEFFRNSCYYVAINNNQQRFNSGLNVAWIVYNAIDTSHYHMVNEDVVKNQRITLGSSREFWRLITFCTRRERLVEFLTNDFDLESGLIAFLYARRRDEKNVSTPDKTTLARLRLGAQVSWPSSAIRSAWSLSLPSWWPCCYTAR